MILQRKYLEPRSLYDDAILQDVEGEDVLYSTETLITIIREWVESEWDEKDVNLWDNPTHRAIEYIEENIIPLLLEEGIDIENDTTHHVYGL